MSFTRTVESRPYDAHYDPVFTGPFHGAQVDARVARAVSGPNVVAGTHRFQYFRRPVMPRISAVPPQVLLAPRDASDPMEPLEEQPEPTTKNAFAQTMYRESEIQTDPYSPEFILKEGDDPEVLMLRALTFQNGLPAGQREIEMIEQARIKREMENNMLPFTDEACLELRKRMMENQEMREFKLREKEVEAKKNARLIALKRALDEREESNEFLSSQRVEAIRQTRMDSHEKATQKIRKSRIKILRRLARQRNNIDPVLSNTTSRDIIYDYYDRGSDVYAPLRRDGKHVPENPKHFDVASRTAPLSSVENIERLQSTMPRRVLESAASGGADLMSKTAPAAGRAAQPRLTSSAQRVLRNTRRDVDTMHDILTRRRLQRSGVLKENSTAKPALETRDDGAGTAASLLHKRPRGRPRTPNIAQQHREETDNMPVYAAVVQLQRLLRGRAVQNIMFEGRYRRSELIAELRESDLHAQRMQQEDIIAAEKQRKDAENLERVKSTTIDAVAGAVTSNVLAHLAAEKQRQDTIESLHNDAVMALNDRIQREAQEAGRRQKQHVVRNDGLPLVPYPNDVPNPHDVMQPKAAPQLSVSPESKEGPQQDINESDQVPHENEKHESVEPNNEESAAEGKCEDVDNHTGAPSTLSSLNSSLQRFADLINDEKVTPEDVLSNMDQYPSVLEAYQNATNDDEREEVCRDFVQVLHSPLKDANTQENDDDSVDTARRELIGLVREKLQSLSSAMTQAENA